MSFTSTSPEARIGVFDSGIGGLTVANALKKLLPNEKLVYFGDTEHMPYGEKSEAALQSFTVKAVNFLMSKKCKLILIACNTASAAAFELAKEYTGSKCKVMNVLDPVVSHVAERYAGKQLGLIATRRTVLSEAYKSKIQNARPDIILNSVATPLLAGMIEEGFYNDNISREVLRKYLGAEGFKKISALILGCTHYPLIKPDIKMLLPESVEVIDGSYIVAEAVRQFLDESGLRNTKEKDRRRDHFFVSDFTPSFEATTSIFFGEKVSLKAYRLWE